MITVAVTTAAANHPLNKNDLSESSGHLLFKYFIVYCSWVLNMTDIIYEDEYIVAAIKPVGIDSEKEMCEQLNSLTSSDYIAVLHRLDTAVSGVMVYAKTKDAAANLSLQIQNGEFKKEYLCVVGGVPKQSHARLEDLLFKDSAKNKSYVVKRERKGVKKAVLDYETLSTAHLDNGDISLLKVRLYTGRTHQIRVQFSSRKLCLLGDKKYGSKFDCPIALFSHKITLSHPKTKKSLTFEAEPDYDKFPFNKFKK